MPIYDYKCPACQHVSIDVYRKMNNESPEVCPVCTAAMERVPVLAHTSMKEFHTPIEMYSIALDTDEEIQSFKRTAPDVDVSTDQNDPMYGIPIARSRHQKLQALRAAGAQEAK